MKYSWLCERIRCCVHASIFPSLPQQVGPQPHPLSRAGALPSPSSLTHNNQCILHDNPPYSSPYPPYRPITVYRFIGMFRNTRHIHPPSKEAKNNGCARVLSASSLRHRMRTWRFRIRASSWSPGNPPGSPGFPLSRNLSFLRVKVSQRFLCLIFPPFYEIKMLF